MAKSSLTHGGGDCNKVELAAACWHAIAKIAAKAAAASRDELTPGASYPIPSIMISAEIEGQVWAQSFVAELSVAHDSERAGASIKADNVLAYVLGQLAPAHRDAILRDLPAVFAANGNDLPTDASIERAAKAVMQQCRATESTKTRGAVACDAKPNGGAAWIRKAM